MNESRSHMKLRASARLVINSENPELSGTFSHGCVMLLEGVVRTKSLNKAAKELGMAYSKAWRLVKEAEAQLGFQLLLRDGARGSSLTPEGERAVEAYRTLQGEVDELVRRRTPELFEWND